MVFPALVVGYRHIAYVHKPCHAVIYNNTSNKQNNRKLSIYDMYWELRIMRHWIKANYYQSIREREKNVLNNLILSIHGVLFIEVCIKMNIIQVYKN